MLALGYGRRRSRAILTWLGVVAALLCALSPAHAAEPAAPQQPLLQAQMLRDPGGLMTLADVSDPDWQVQGRWQPVAAESVALGFSRDAIWFRFVLPGLAEGAAERWLVAGLPFLDDLQLHLPQPTADAPGALWRAGDHVPVAERPTRLREAVFPVRLEAAPATSGTYYLRLRSTSTLTLKLELWEPRAYAAHLTTQQALQGLLQGLMVTSAVVGLLAGWWLRQAFFFIAAAYLLSFGAINLVLNGYDQLLVYPAHPGLADHVVGVLGFATTLLIVAFALSYLQPRRFYPRLHGALVALGGVCALGALASALGFYGALAPWFFKLALLVVLLLMALFGLMLRHERRKAVLMLLMFAPGLLAIVLQVLRNLGLLPTNFWTTRLWELTALFQMPYVAVVLLLQLRDGRLHLAQAQDREREQQDFMNLMAHELRTPLAVLGTALANIELRSQAPAAGVQSDLKPRFQRAATALARLNALVDNALAESRLRDARIHLDLQPTRPSQLLEQVRPLMLVDAPHELRTSLPADDSPVLIDAQWLGIAVLNLIDNAIKYAPEGGVVQLDIERTPQTLRLTVRDSGIGVPPEAQPALFERFYRAGNARQLGGAPGLGLGLFLVAEVARRHGGRAGVESTVGVGSRFTVDIPLQASKA